MILERGQSIERFVVLGLVGRGGMGEVYAAYDPELDRKVAIKLLRAQGARPDGKTRLLREAQAIAKLQHPNVVVVYDVGTFGDSVFIAMEFVEGRTVTGWLQAAARTRREILEVYRAAGQGLAAAHAAGLVHRDFKPDNVMVGDDGQVRVMDFGLARQTGEADEPRDQAREIVAAALEVAGRSQPALDPEATVDLRKPGAPAVVTSTTTSSGKYLSVKLTQTGAVLGTPAYMAPEQFDVRPTDARTDQFSFCVSLYEALYGQRPFEGETFVALMTSVTTGAVREATSGVPSWLRKVLLRGLATDPERRFPSMSELLTALATDPTARAKRVGAVAGAVICLALAAVGARRATGTDRAMCRGGDERLAGVWEPRGRPSARKDAISRAFLATGKSYAPQAFAGASRLLDEYVDGWLRIYGEACEATHFRGEQSPEVLDLRMACLQERFVSVSALGELFAHADPSVVENAVAAAGALPRLDGCSDVALLKAVVRPPQDEPTRRRVEALQAERARVAALSSAGHCADAARAADALIVEVRRVGYKPLLAETLNTAGLLADQCTEVSVGLERFREAFSVALECRHDEAATAAAIYHGDFLGDRAAQPQAGRRWLEISKGMLRRIGGSAWWEAMLLSADAKITQSEDLATAIAKANAAHVAIRKVAGDDHPYSLSGYLLRGLSLANAGRYDEALAVDREGRARASAVLGADTPTVAMLSVNEGEVLHKLRRFAEARAAFARAIDIWRRAGSDPFFVAYGLTGLGLACLGDHQAGAAVTPLEEALRIRTDKHVDAEHMGETRFALARALWSRPPDRTRALALAREARVAYAEVKTPTTAGSLADVDRWLAAPSDGL